MRPRSSTRVGIPGATLPGCGQRVSWISLAAPRLERTLRWAELRARLVVLDLRELTFIDCSGVHRIVGAAIRARRVGNRLILVRGPSQVDRVLALTGVSAFIEIRDLEPGEPVVQVLVQLTHEDQAASNLSRPPTNDRDSFEGNLGCVGRTLRGEVRLSLQEAPARKGGEVQVAQATQSEGISSRAALQTETEDGLTAAIARPVDLRDLRVVW